jgi:ATP-dependent phosphofructokinase / diphosphate-dependent phosphofructokinase
MSHIPGEFHHWSRAFKRIRGALTSGTMNHSGKLGILVGGGPAPGTNSVIAAAAIRGSLAGVDVIGLLDGFAHLRGTSIPQRLALPIEAVSQVHFRGGSILRSSRDVPATPAEDAACVGTLRMLGVNKLITIGGDETCRAAMRIASEAAGALRVVHVPKTIDNDLPLPAGIQALGYETARHVGVGLVRDLLVDAKTMGRWYFLTTMGRSAGHLALGIGKAAGASLTIIPEEVPSGPIRLDWIVDTLVGAIVKRLSNGRRDGVALLAEGLAERLTLDEQLLIRRGPPGSPVRLGELKLGEVVRDRVLERLAEYGIQETIAEKSIGYELRSADPIPFDMEYARDLGYCAAKFLLEGGRDAMVTMVAGKFCPVPFADIAQSATGGLQPRPVDTDTETYKIARRYMLRLRRDDFQDGDVLARLAATANISSEAFRQRFAYLVSDEAPPLRFLPQG